ncbi:MAG: acetolactate synthase small subunit [Chloroflexi bacterium]|nr:acetolactate synthase small subunit [Chloroflexota bacterium]|tara:strand:+ start:1294 stop:1893 length:600 start_codon:yes stop_codon:yes gene_type:complete
MVNQEDISNHINQRTISSLVQDKPGVLSRIAGLFRRRGFNIVSLAVGSSEISGLSRMTFVVEGPGSALRTVADQLKKLIDVVEAKDITDKNIVWRELALIKVNSNKKNRSEILELAEIFRVNVIDIGVSNLTMEITGGKEKIDSLVELLRKFGLREVIRTGRVATLRGTLIEGKSDGEFQYQTKSGDDLSETFFESGSV